MLVSTHVWDRRLLGRVEVRNASYLPLNEFLAFLLKIRMGQKLRSYIYLNEEVGSQFLP